MKFNDQINELIDLSLHVRSSTLSMAHKLSCYAFKAFLDVFRIYNEFISIYRYFM